MTMPGNSTKAGRPTKRPATDADRGDDQGVGPVEAHIGGLRCLVVNDQLPKGTPTVVLLHGYDMVPEDLAPFGASIALPLRFVFPQGPVKAVGEGAPRKGYAWWPTEIESDSHAADDARCRLRECLAGLVRKYAPRRWVLGGFSQGALLSCDYVLRTGWRPSGLIVLSGVLPKFADWPRAAQYAQGLPVLQSHGEADEILAMEAGISLRDHLEAWGADLQWRAFPGAHDIPLVVWRHVKKFISALGT